MHLVEIILQCSSRLEAVNGPVQIIESLQRQRDC